MVSLLRKTSITLQQTHFFTRVRYAQVEKYTSSLTGALVSDEQLSTVKSWLRR